MIALTAIRRSTPADTGRMFDIWRAAVLATHDFLAPADFDEIEQLVRDQYLPSAEFLVATDDEDRPHAFLGMLETHVDALFVDPAARGQGIGRAMLAHVAADVGPLTVDVNAQNVQAVGFYEHLGFKVTGRSSTDDQGRPYPLLHMAQTS